MRDHPSYRELEQKFRELETRLKEVQVVAQRYRQLFEDAPIPLYQTTPEGEILYANRAAVKLLGYPDVETLMHENAGNLENREDREKIHEILREKGFVEAYETQLRRYDGTYVWVKDTSRAVFDEDGNILYFNGSVEDITERKKTEEELQKRQKYLESVLNSVPDAIITLDPSHRVVEWNPGAERIFGYTREEVKGRALDDLIAPDELLQDAKKYTRLVLSGSRMLPVEVIRCQKDGSRIDLIASGAPIMIGNKLVGIVGIYTDISEQKKVRKALEESERRYRSLFDRLPVGLFVTTPEGRFVDANPAFLTMMGCPDLETLLNTPVLSFYESPRKREEWKNLIESSKEKVAIELKLKRMDGSPIWVRESARAVRNETGQVISYEGVIEDITEIKQAEEEKKELEARLIQAQKMEAIGTLAAGIAHNFNNILMGIQGNVSLLKFELGRGHELEERLEAIEKLIRSAARLTSQLLGYARKGQFEVRLLRMNEIIKETAETFGSTRKEISINLELEPELKGVRADQGQMEQMLLNLYVNAAEAMPKGGSLTIKTRNVSETAMRGRPYSPPPGDYVMITITDTGMGMDREVMIRIFEPFFTTKGLAKGTGLGLASVYGIVKSHKGFIDVFSKKGKGTRFEIFLPASATIEVENTLSSNEQPVKGSGTILLIDDEEVVVDVGKGMLESLGYHVLTATSGRRALEIFREHKGEIDLVILDLILPEMGGGEIYARLKEIDPDVRVLLSSGYSIEGEAQEMLERGCNGFIQKPFDIKALSQEVKQLTGQ